MATMKDIANKTGLGLATISKYLNGGKVREYNRVAIEQAIIELEYTVNEFARGLKTKKSYTVGVVIPELDNTFITSIITIVEDILRNEGYGVIICGCRTNEVYEADAINFLLGKNVDGIINMPVTKDGSHLNPAIEKKIPIILIDRMIPDLENQVSAVLGHDEQASYRVIQSLIAAGHSKIGILLGEKGIYTTNQRLLGYKKALEKNNIEEKSNYIVFSDYTVQGGYRSIKQLIKEQEITAVFVTNYEMTLGTMIAINEMGLAIPEVLSVIGFDNLQLSQVIKPKLTIVNQPIERIAESAANLFLQLEKEKTNNKIIMVDLEIEQGESVEYRNKS